MPGRQLHVTADSAYAGEDLKQYYTHIEAKAHKAAARGGREAGGKRIIVSACSHKVSNMAATADTARWQEVPGSNYTSR